MPYIKFASYPVSTEGRTLTSGITDPVSGEYLAETDTVLPSDTIVSDGDYATALTAANAAYEAEVLKAAAGAKAAAKAAEIA